jgi:hypothetical protein
MNTYRYREGAKGHCYYCGKTRQRHGPLGQCPEGRIEDWAEKRAGERVAPKLRGEGSEPLDFPAGRAGRR